MTEREKEEKEREREFVCEREGGTDLHNSLGDDVEGVVGAQRIASFLNVRPVFPEVQRLFRGQGLGAWAHGVGLNAEG